MARPESIGRRCHGIKSRNQDFHLLYQLLMYWRIGNNAGSIQICDKTTIQDSLRFWIPTFPAILLPPPRIVLQRGIPNQPPPPQKFPPATLHPSRTSKLISTQLSSAYITAQYIQLFTIAWDATLLTHLHTVHYTTTTMLKRYSKIRLKGVSVHFSLISQFLRDKY